MQAHPPKAMCIGRQRTHANRTINLKPTTAVWSFLTGVVTSALVLSSFYLISASLLVRGVGFQVRHTSLPSTRSFHLSLAFRRVLLSNTIMSSSYHDFYHHLTQHIVPGPQSLSYFVTLLILPLALLIPRSVLSRWYAVTLTPTNNASD